MSALGLYRLARRLDIWRVPLLPRVFEKLILLICRCVVPRRCEIGGGTELGYGGIAVVIHERARIGRNVMISPCVTIGGRSGIYGVPVIEDDVFIGAGAKVLGDIGLVGERSSVPMPWSSSPFRSTRWSPGSPPASSEVVPKKQ